MCKEFTGSFVERDAYLVFFMGSQKGKLFLTCAKYMSSGRLYTPGMTLP